MLLDVVVALVAQLRLRCLQEMRRCFGGMDAVAARAAHVGFDVGGTIGARMISVMTCAASLIHFTRAGRGETEDLCHVAALRVRLAATVAIHAVTVRFAQFAVRVDGGIQHGRFVAARAIGGFVHAVGVL